MPEFVPLETFLRPPEAPVAVTATSPDEAFEDVPDREDDAFDEALAAARRFRAALSEALDTAVEAILREIAVAVVARELQLAPADIAAIVSDACRRYSVDDVLRVRAHPDETGALAGLGLCVVADEHLRRGDVEIDLRDGTIDATLGARIERIVAP